jgi:hypothetical protein
VNFGYRIGAVSRFFSCHPGFYPAHVTAGGDGVLLITAISLNN